MVCESCFGSASELNSHVWASQSTQQAMSVLNYMVNKETTIDPTLLEGATQENLHDRVGASSVGPFGMLHEWLPNMY